MAITGASGLVGTALRRSLAVDGHSVVRLVRHTSASPPGHEEAHWDPVGGEVDTDALRAVDAVVHLAGAPLGPTRWTPEYKQLIYDSRVNGTRALCTALAEMDQPPPRLLSASAVGYYGETGPEVVDEDAPHGDGFLAEVASAWEAAATAAEESGISVAYLRSGVVLSSEGGLLGKVLPLFRMGLGGRLGDGRQYMSWISIADEVGAIRFLLEHPEITGPVNLCAPEPISNAEYTAALGRALHRPAFLAVPAVAMRSVLGEFADETALIDQRVRPRRLLEADYAFRHPELEGALSDIL
ncbi:TIGR01777 family protein [Nocardiopsis gilva YIM 90087]|uniref:TIGR01777 family protein n=1 Tax=Nocardiopsis gilva YIM 90087 TaxID=1235441 RepID=A0A223SDM1_9ACTN|nr:TIGR01777 family protein [Nocardiopsis gilva YIM 90087]